MPNNSPVARVRERGFQSLHEYAKTMPLASLNELAASLGEDVAPIQVQWELLDEGYQGAYLKLVVQDLLVRRLRNVSSGWPSTTEWDDQREVRYHLTAWEGGLAKHPLHGALKVMTDALLNAKDIPAGWLPGGVDDPRVTELFDKFWPADA